MAYGPELKLQQPLVFSVFLIGIQASYAAKMSCAYGCRSITAKGPVSVDQLEHDAVKWENVNQIQFNSLKGRLDNDGVFRFEDGDHGYSYSTVIRKSEVPLVVGKQFYLTIQEPRSCEVILICTRTE